MKGLFFICVLFTMGCYEHIPEGVRAQMIAENFLDTLYRPDTVENKLGINYITIKDYMMAAKQKVFQTEDSGYCNLSVNGWVAFTKRVNDILSKGKGRVNGIISVESYTVKGIKYTGAFFVDSSFRKIFATIPIDQSPVPTGK